MLPIQATARRTAPHAVVETLSAAYIPHGSQFRDGFALLNLLAVLFLKPEGLWGIKEEWA